MKILPKSMAAICCGFIGRFGSNSGNKKSPRPRGDYKVMSAFTPDTQTLSFPGSNFAGTIFQIAWTHWC